MQDIIQDPLVSLIAARMEEVVSHGADIPELAALTIDAVLAECVSVLELRAAQHMDERAQAAVLDCVEALLAAQFSGPAPVPARR